MTMLSEKNLGAWQPSQANDEISLAELLHHLIVRWKVILASIGVMLAVAIVYLIAATPKFTTKLSYGVETGGADTLNSIPGIEYTERQLTDELSQRLSSYENFRRYTDESELGKEQMTSLPDGARDENSPDGIERFFDELTAVRPIQDEGGSYLMRLSYPQGFAGPSFLNDYFEWTLDGYANDLVDRSEYTIEAAIRRNRARMAAYEQSYAEDIASRITRLKEEDSVRVAELRDRLEAERNALVASREARIEKLKQAEQMASILGIETPTTPREFGRSSASNREIVYTEINSSGALPLYFMGTRALQAEREVLELNLKEETRTAAIRDIEKEISQLEHNRTIEALTEREENPPFIDKYLELEQQNKLLRANSVTADEIRLASVNRWAYRPASPDGPKALLVVVLALIVGGMAGILLLGVMALWSQARKLGAA